jgi:hypothetical protein
MVPLPVGQFDEKFLVAGFLQLIGGFERQVLLGADRVEEREIVGDHL